MRDIFSADYSFKDMGLKFLLPGVIIWGGLTLAQKGGYVDSKINTFGRLFQSEDPITRIETTQSKQHFVHTAGLYVNGSAYSPGGKHFHKYKGELNDFNFDFKADGEDGIKDISLLVDGIEVEYTRVKKDEFSVTGNAQFKDFKRKENYEVELIVNYKAGGEDRVKVLVCPQ